MATNDSHLIDAIFKLSRFMKDSVGGDLTSLSMLQLQALVFLKKHSGSQMGDIAENFSIELPSATSLVNKLVKANLVLRKADIKDRRLVRVELTKKGEFLLKKAREEKTKRIMENLQVLSDTEKKDLLIIIEKMAKRIDEAYDK